MKFFLIAFVLIIGAALFYTYILADDIPDSLKKEIDGQPNPFVVPKDSAAVVWARARQLLIGRRSLIVGGELEETDSTLMIPYYNEARKGNSVEIKQYLTGDSVHFEVKWWYAQKAQEKGAKEIALFMQKRISRYTNF